MTHLTRQQSAAPAAKVLGLGGAGCNILSQLARDGFSDGDLIALNTDMQALDACEAGRKIQLGREAARGLGTGGDADAGYAAANEASEEISAAVAQTDLIFLCAGLGGGTGSGAAPLVAHLARKAGAFVVALVTMPFTFELKRRATQAAAALAQIEQQANLVVCFENDRMAADVTEDAQRAFVASDATLSGCIRAFAAMLSRRGLLPVGLDDIAASLRRQDARGLFGYGEGEGANRMPDALEQALRCPLMDAGKMLAGARTVLVHVSGGPDLTLHEVSAMMAQFNRHISDGTRVNFGLTTDAALGRRACVAILSSTGTDAAPRIIEAPVRKIPAFAEPQPAPMAALFSPPEPADEPAARAEKPAAAKTGKAPKVEQMPLEPANRGRFEKSEPTIVDGQDLDVPTFMRKNLKVK